MSAALCSDSSIAGAPSAVLEAQLRACLRDALGVESIEFAAWRMPEGGASSQTRLFEARFSDGIHRHALRLVLRSAEPEPLSLQKEYDLARQAHCMQFVGSHGFPPVPRVVATRLQGPVPFFVMEAVEGLALADSHRMFASGVLHAATFSQQRAFYDDCVRCMAALHALVPDDATTALLQRRNAGQTALERELAWLRETFEWGKGPGPQPVIEAAFDRLEAALPATEEAVVLWGDARPPNMIMKDFQVAACLDWELASLGPGALDLFWFIELNTLKAGRHWLDGFRSPADTLALYEAYRGRRVEHADFCRLFVVTKMAVMTLRFMLLAFERGSMANGLDLARFDKPTALTDNPAIRRLSELLEVGV